MTKRLSVMAVALTLAILLTAWLVPVTANADPAGNVEVYPDVSHTGQPSPVSVQGMQYYVTPDGTIYNAYVISSTLFVRRFDGTSWIYASPTAGITITNSLWLDKFAVAPNGDYYFGLTLNSHYSCAYKYANGIVTRLVYNDYVKDFLFTSGGQAIICTSQGIYYTSGSTFRLACPYDLSNYIPILDFTLGPTMHRIS